MTPIRNEKEVIKEAYSLLHSNRTADAVEHLWRSFTLPDPLALSPALYFTHARLVGHIGEFSEALRVMEDLRASSGIPPEWIDRAGIWSAVYWGRLEEWKRAQHLLKLHSPPEHDSETVVAHWSHRLTTAIESRDTAATEAALDDFRSVCEVVEHSETDFAEMELWRSLLLPMAVDGLVPEDVEKLALEIPTRQAAVGKKNIAGYIRLWLARLWLHCGEREKALECFESARTQALASNCGNAYLRATLDLIDALKGLDQTPSELKLRLIKQALVVGGQHGLGLLPCRIS